MINTNKTKNKKLLSFLSLSLSYLIMLIVMLFCTISIFTSGSTVNILGVEFSIVQSESMKNTINKYDFLVFTKANAKNIKEGDIIVFYDDSGLYKVVHRVADITYEGTQALYTTKGDNNPANDLGYRTSEDIYAKYAFKLPFIGYVITFLKSKYGLLIIAMNLLNYCLISALWKSNNNSLIEYKCHFKK